MGGGTKREASATPGRRLPPTAQSATVAAGSESPRCEVECLPGLEDIVQEEIASLLGDRARVRSHPIPGRLTVRLRGQPWPLEALRCAVAVHLVAQFDVPRPKALLGHQHFTRLLALLRGLVEHHPSGAFSAVRISAAGADSPVFTRLKDELERALALPGEGDEGDLLLSARRPADGSPGWELLARTTPRPLSARAWRVCSMPGALNAAVAQAMIRLARPRPTDRFLNLACGSGTFLVERLQTVPTRSALGLDISTEALRCARANLQAGGCAGAGALVRGDVAALPLETASYNAIVTDLPFGMLVGSTDENRALYPALLREAARVTVPGGVLAAVTAARRLFDASLRRSGAPWALERSLAVRLPYKESDMPVGVYLLRRT